MPLAERANCAQNQKNITMKDKTKNELNGIKINLTIEDEQQIKNLLSDLKFQKTSIETLFAIIKTGEGKIYFETTLNELAKELFGDVASKTKKKLRDNFRSRKDTILERQEKMKERLIDMPEPQNDGREGRKNQLKPFIVEVDLILLKNLINLNNKHFSESEIKFKELRKIYGLS